MGKILEAKELKKYFEVKAGTLHAVDGVSFSLDEGETLGVVGESGCGKSTLGRVLIHLLESTDGQLLYKGEDITHVSRSKLTDLRHEMQMIFQDPFASLNPRRTVFQAISEPMEIAGTFSKKEIDERVYEMMDTVGLARRLVNCYPHELDGGRRQRIGIARALIIDPKLIICDEPVSALDVSIQAQIINLLLDIQEQRKLTYVFITHDMMVVKYISSKIMVMYLGQMVEMAPTNKLFEMPMHPYSKALLSAVPQLDVDHKHERIVLKGEVYSPIDPKPGCRFAARCPYATDACRIAAPPLKELLPDHLVACHRAEEINGL
ncbi:MAG: dipeptide ABC transporter ATP-binding protein [Eubacteriales bacterium]|nr:dipeptide ABC transporter ATP-binding protein [Eubacteriales bacterium]